MPRTLNVTIQASLLFLSSWLTAGSALRDLKLASNGQGSGGMPALSAPVPEKAGVYGCCGLLFDEGRHPGGLRKHQCEKHSDRYPEACSDSKDDATQGRTDPGQQRDSALRQAVGQAGGAAIDAMDKSAHEGGVKAKAMKEEGRKRMAQAVQDWGPDVVQLDGDTPIDLKKYDPKLPDRPQASVPPLVSGTKVKKEPADPCPDCCDLSENFARWNRLPPPAKED